MQLCRSLAQNLKNLRAVESNRTVLRPFSALATTNKRSTNTTPQPVKQATELSNRQKFNQIQPPIKLYEKLEKLGFGTLLKTKRFAGVHKQKAKRDQQRLQHTERVGPPPEPKYAVRIINLYGKS